KQKDVNVSVTNTTTMTKIVLKGSKHLAPVDEHFFDHKKYHVHEDNSCVWDAMLNQTNISHNNNKFYLLQVLVHDADKSCGAWFRWGRVGAVGQSKWEPCGNDLARAKALFEQKFLAKSATEWSERDPTFVPPAGKYTYLERDYTVKDVEEELKAV